MIRRKWSRGSRAWGWLAVSMLGAALTGCGSGDFVPPPPADLRDAIGSGPAGPGTGTVASVPDPFSSGAMTVRSIEMIMAPGQDANELEVEKASARSQAGIDRARLRIWPEETTDGSGKPAGPARSQVELIREAIGREPRERKPQALIVEPADPADPELARAVAEARNARVPVILLGRPLKGSPKPGETAGAPLIVVQPSPFTESARKIVELAIRNARNADLDPQAGAVLVFNPESDVFIADRVAAVREALKAAKIDNVHEVHIRQDIDVGGKILADHLKADTKPQLVFSFDFVSASASNKAVGLIAEERPFVQAGYTSDDNLFRQALSGEFAALGEFVPARLIKRAVSTAVAAAQGKEMPSRVEVLVTVRESPPTAGAPHAAAHGSPRTKAAGRSKKRAEPTP